MGTEALVIELRAARHRTRLTQQQIASLIGLARTSIANFEAGRQDMPISKVIAYATAVRVVLVPVPHSLLPAEGATDGT